MTSPAKADDLVRTAAKLGGPSVARLVEKEIDTLEHPQPRSRNAVVLRTPAQRGYMVTLADQQGIGQHELNLKIRAEYGQTLDTITKTNASKLIDGLLKNLRSMR